MSSQIVDEEWSSHKNEIYKTYILENKTLEEVISHMAKQHDLKKR